MAGVNPSILDRVLGPEPDLPAPRGLDPDRRAAVVLWSTAILLVLLIFRAGFPSPGDLNAAWKGTDPYSLWGRIYWAAWGFLFYLVVPMAIVLFVFREPPSRFGFRLYLTRRTALVYLGLVAFMVPFLFWAGTQESFLRKYPFAHDLGGAWGRIVAWEAVYLSRFLALEFFFRGFLLFGLEARLGRTNAIAATVVPYAIMHFAKPFPEAAGALVAGAVLGAVALHTRTILGGVIMHTSVALGMDLVALWKKGAIF